LLLAGVHLILTAHPFLPQALVPWSDPELEPQVLEFIQVLEDQHSVETVLLARLPNH
jgi:hypothetical protein